MNWNEYKWGRPKKTFTVKCIMALCANHSTPCSYVITSLIFFLFYLLYHWLASGYWIRGAFFFFDSFVTTLLSNHWWMKYFSKLKQLIQNDRIRINSMIRNNVCTQMVRLQLNIVAGHNHVWVWIWSLLFLKSSLHCIQWSEAERRRRRRKKNTCNMVNMIGI